MANAKRNSGLILTFAWLTVCQPVIASMPDPQGTLQLNAVTPVKPIDDSWFNQENIKKYCPAMSPTTDQLALAQQIQTSLSQKITDAVLASTKESLIKQDPALKSLNNKVEAVTKPSVSFAPTKSSVVQKFNFNLKAWERQAIAAYDGYFHSDITYRMSSNDVVFNVSKPLSKNTTLALTNTSPVGQINQAGNLTLTYNF